VKQETYGIAFFLGLLIRVCFIYFKDVMNDKVQDRSALKS